jgi:hypothetical protein
MKNASLIVILLLAVHSVSDAQNPKRTVRQILSSEQLPNIQIEVESALSYIGNVSFDVDTIARAEEYIFSEIHSAKMGRTLIVHFESFLPDNDLKFNYPRFRMKKLGDNEYLHQIFHVKNFELFRTRELVNLFKDKGLVYESDWMMNRYVRAVDRAKKNELILFYLEPANSFSSQIRDEAEKSDPRETVLTEWQKELSERALKSFNVIRE